LAVRRSCMRTTGDSSTAARLSIASVVWMLAALIPLAHANPAEARDPGLDLSRWRGQVVLLDFWASWCGPCRQSFPWMAKMREKYGGRGLVVVAVGLDEDRDAADRFLAGMEGDFVHVRDPKGGLAETFGVAVMPSSLLFDRTGRPVYRHEGFHMDEAGAYEQRIVDLLENRSPAAALAIAPAVAKGLGVRPWQRGVLADPAMRLASDPLEIELDEHTYFSKEASSGGRGFGGGGCGCN
jgi:thiol-disulfide isomerase/thioredoxin